MFCLRCSRAIWFFRRWSSRFLFCILSHSFLNSRWSYFRLLASSAASWASSVFCNCFCALCRSISSFLTRASIYAICLSFSRSSNLVWNLPLGLSCCTWLIRGSTFCDARYESGMASFSTESLFSVASGAGIANFESVTLPAAVASLRLLGLLMVRKPNYFFGT